MVKIFPYTGTEQKTLENSAAYIAGWLKQLKNDKTLLVHAAAAAQKAADFILNRLGGGEEIGRDSFSSQM